MPESAPPFVFRDGFEGSAKIEELSREVSLRWKSAELLAPGGGPGPNRIGLTTERAHTGQNALKCIAAPYDGKKTSEADIDREGLRFVKGDDVWFSAWYWLEGQTEGSTVFLWDLESTALRNTPGRRLFLQNGEMVASDLGKWWSAKKFQAISGAPKFPKNKWVEVKIHLRLSDKTDGRMQVWQDGVRCSMSRARPCHAPARSTTACRSASRPTPGAPKPKRCLWTTSCCPTGRCERTGARRFLNRRVRKRAGVVTPGFLM
jgi:hypothetical protein